MREIFISFLGGLLLSVSATAQPAAPVKPTAKKAAPSLDTRKRIGLITEIGNTFSVQKVGIMVFGNEQTSVPIGSWGIDALVAAKAASVMKENFNVIPINLSREGQAELAHAPGNLFSDRSGYICGVLRKETRGQDFSFYLRIKPGMRPYRTTWIELSGLGIVQGNGLVPNTFVHALLWIEAIDGQTCKILKIEEPSVGDGGDGLAIYGRNQKVDDSWMPGAPSVAAQDTRLRDLTKELVQQGLAESFSHIRVGFMNWKGKTE